VTSCFCRSCTEKMLEQERDTAQASS
jgi:hypothetical protein